MNERLVIENRRAQIHTIQYSIKQEYLDMLIKIYFFYRLQLYQQKRQPMNECRSADRCVHNRDTDKSIFLTGSWSQFKYRR